MFKLFCVTSLVLFNLVLSYYLSENDIPDYCLKPFIDDERFDFHCWAKIPRYTYDPETKICVFFFYGGCSKNLNNFETAEECVEVCSADGYEPRPW